ncbi:AraC family transcriptional regulator [Eubacteriales bacterium OttesenSCG-928-A19]|nr:AraC family transcriptional regulator [Eubacteriales bacterium OttesenSCG-928-A19]
MSTEITTVTQPMQEIHGLWGKSSDRTISKDIPALSKKYYEIVGKSSGSVIPFFVLSKNYDEQTQRFDLFVGGQIEHEQLESYCLPEGVYGKVTVRPRFGFLWGMAVGRAKQHFYTKWLPSSEYAALNMEYELHTEKSTGKKPEIEVLFAITQEPKRQRG